MLTKKHLEAIAELFRDTAPRALNNNDAGLVWLDLRRGIANIAAEQNPRFDRKRFYRATDPNGRL